MQSIQRYLWNSPRTLGRWFLWSLSEGIQSINQPINQRRAEIHCPLHEMNFDRMDRFRSTRPECTPPWVLSFVLHLFFLFFSFFHRSPSDAPDHPRGSIRLKGTRISTEETLTFAVHKAGDQTFHLKASSEVERQRWITAIELAKTRALKGEESSGNEAEGLSRSSLVLFGFFTFKQSLSLIRSKKYFVFVFVFRRRWWSGGREQERPTGRDTKSQPENRRADRVPRANLQTRPCPADLNCRVGGIERAGGRELQGKSRGGTGYAVSADQCGFVERKVSLTQSINRMTACSINRAPGFAASLHVFSWLA